MFAADRNCIMKPISEIAEVIAGGDKPKDNSNEQTDEYKFPVYANGIDEEGLQCYAKDYRVDSPAVTISARGTIGATFIREPYFTPVVRLIAVIPGDMLDVTYLKYAIDLTGVSSNGSNQQQLTIPNISKVKIPLPELREQIGFVDMVKQSDKSKFYG